MQNDRRGIFFKKSMQRSLIKSNSVNYTYRKTITTNAKVYSKNITYWGRMGIIKV